MYYNFRRITLSKKTCKDIIDSKNNYIITVKNNQKTLLRNIKNIFKKQIEFQMSDSTIEPNGDRIEIRKIRVSKHLDGIDIEEWCGLKSVIELERTRIIKGKKHTEISYYISSLEVSASEYAKIIREHWHIENKLHHVLDRTMLEDKSKIRINPRGFHCLRVGALNFLRLLHSNNITETMNKLGHNFANLAMILRS